jgi:tyrosinase
MRHTAIGTVKMAVGFLILISVWATSAQAGVNQGRHRRHIVEDFTFPDNNHASAGTVFPILGIGGAGKKMAYPRLEIRELERSRDQFNLYLLGLQRFQGVSQDDEFSYFRIAGRCYALRYQTRANVLTGIHGRPFTPWDGVEKNPEGKLGYCRHSSNIFPTWHRPYLALIEVRGSVASLIPADRRRKRYTTMRAR